MQRALTVPGTKAKIAKLPLSWTVASTCSGSGGFEIVLAKVADSMSNHLPHESRNIFSATWFDSYQYQLQHLWFSTCDFGWVSWPTYCQIVEYNSLFWGTRAYGLWIRTMETESFDELGCQYNAYMLRVWWCDNPFRWWKALVCKTQEGLCFLVSIYRSGF